MKDRLQDPNSSLYGLLDDSTDSNSYFNGISGNIMNNHSHLPLLERITDLTPNLVALYNIQTGKYVFINKALKPLLGYEPSDWIQKGVNYVSSKVHPDDLPRIIKENQKAVEEDSKFKGHFDNNPIVEFEYRIKNANGEYRWLRTYGTVFDRDETGRIKHVINISLDITTIKATEEKLLRLTEDLEKKVEERTRDAEIRLEIKEVLSKNGELEEVLNQCTQILAKRLQASVVRIWAFDEKKDLKLFAASYIDEFKKEKKVPVWEKIKSGQVLKESKPYLTDKIGSRDFSDKLWVKKHKLKSFALYPLILDNKLVGVLSILSKHQISAQTHESLFSIAYSIAYGVGRLQAQEALINSEQKYHTIFSTLTEGVVLQDPQGRIMEANSSAQEILNGNFEELNKRASDKGLRSSYINEDGSAFDETQFPFLQALKTGEPQKNKIMGIIKDKRTTWISTNSIPLTDDEGKTYAIASSFQDITEQKRLEKQKDEFISIASHELKTPLTTIKSFNEILKMQFGKEQKAQYYLGKMHSEIDRLTGLVNELLDVSKIQSGGLTLNKEKIDVDKFVKEVIEDIQTTSPRHKIIFKSKILTKLYADKHRLYQVLINLISNAIKYSPKADKVVVSVEEDPGRVIFKIKDFGIGISKRDKRRVFDAFFQASNTIRQSHSGLGLGLHIAGEIVKRHGGAISVFSKKGYGSVFRFCIPTDIKS